MSVYTDWISENVSRDRLCTMIASPDRIVVQRRESLCSRVKGGVVPAVGADARGRVLPRQDVIDAHGGQLSDANGHAGADSGPADGPAGSKVAPR